MRVLKIVAEGITTSFRYPHFMQRVHPTYPMPPPATIYGHICSTLGEWFDPHGVQFAYHFTAEGRTVDLEHIIVLSSSTSKLPGTEYPKVMEGKVNPFERELLFRPSLTLYINQPEWEEAFCSPHYAVALVSSQDLFNYTQITTVELEQVESAYFEHTLAPHEMALQFGRGIALTMPRYLDYARNRLPTFGQYLALQDRVFVPRDLDFQFENMQYGPYWVDPTSPEVQGMHLGLPFLSFINDIDG